MNHKEYIRELPGSTEAVLMVHGIVGTPEHFRPMLDAVPADFSVYNILLEGHGGTARDFARSSMEQWRAQVVETLAVLCEKYERVYILAHSMGTLLAMEAALGEPEKVAGMLMLASPMRVGVKPRTVLYALQLAFGLEKPGSGAELMRKDSGVEITWRLWQYIGWIPRYLELFALIRRCRELVKELDMPCCAIQSARDELVSRRAAEYLRANPKLEIHELERSGHFGYEPQELEFIKEKLRKMLKGEVR